MYKRSTNFSAAHTLRYDETKKHLGPDDPYDLNDGFVHAAIHGPGGTCGTLPIILASVGRRLGYPIRLVSAKAHLFARWDDPATGDRFNIAWNGQGWDDEPDEHYRQWPLPISAAEERAVGFLESMTPRRELAKFVARRAHQFRNAGNFRRAVAAMVVAGDLVTDRIVYPEMAKRLVLEWEAKLRQARPPGFPHVELLVRPSRRRWPQVVMEFEERVRSLEAVEDVLQKADLERDWWAPLRAGRRPARPVPAKITVDGREHPCLTRP
jgi:hypothetical protein